MALVEVGAFNHDIGDIASQTKELEQQVRDYNRELQQLDRELSDTHKEKGLLETALMLSELQKNKLKNYDRLNAAKPDPEVAAKLQDLRNKLKLEQKQTAQAEEAKKTATAQYNKKMKRLNDLKALLDETKLKTNWAQISKGHHANRDYLGQENRLRELKQQLQHLEDEQQIQRQLTIKKTELIEQLGKKLDELRDVSEEMRKLKEQIQDKESEKVDLEDELRTLNRIYHKKECLIKDMQKDNDVNDPARIKRLESDKKVLQYEITKHADGRRANDKTIQAQHHRLKTLEAKLQAIATALRNMKKDLSEEHMMRFRPNIEDPTQEMVDASLFKALQTELESARGSIEKKDVLMMQKDVTIEVLEKKVEILVNAREVLLRKMKLESAEKEREKRQIHRAIERDEEQHAYAKSTYEQKESGYNTLLVGRN